ncbi:alpha-E domain-containing protein [Cellvibrio polysaccharolyticus]|uniref:Alpha-E domain-containing protein n=1 Tax=Cellvibrio polysaccharolyticus TaxID=2082724 RepID=A0A928YTF1_9GAMM|nr:alpha-E domain-containing protein [Cellvibrio polysaccharolyticus]MBE8716787.1 alpha-E domain-containing protein [Cellvibrio polysaccharolyticus]
MLSRVAERIYWLGRYMERGENVARLVNVNSNLLLDLPRGTRLGWGALIDISGTGEYFNRDTDLADERTVVRFMLMDKDNPSSLLNSLSWARENARITREIIPMEAWELVNDLYHFIKDKSAAVLNRRERSAILLQIISQVQQFTGLLTGCMTHNDAYDFIRIGRNLERADMTTRIVDAGLVHLLPKASEAGSSDDEISPYNNVMWMSVLRSLSGYQMYRQHVRDRVNAKDVVKFLLQNENFPRAAAHSLRELEQCLKKLPMHKSALLVATQVHKKMGEADVGELLTSSGLHDYIDEIQEAIGRVHECITETWFLPLVHTPSAEPRLAVV